MTAGSWPAYGASPWRTETRRATPLAALRRLDWVLTVSVLTLSLLGAVLVWSATREEMIAKGSDPQYFLKRHLVNLGLGLLLSALTIRIDARRLRVYAPLLYVASLAGLLAVLAAGATVNGAKAWILLPLGLSLQPSEFAKVAVVVVMAVLLSGRQHGGTRPRGRDVALALALAAVPTALILAENDLGTVMVFAVTVFGLVATSGARMTWIVGLMLTAVLGAGAVVASGQLDDYQVRRLTSFVNPSADPRGAGYNSQQARIAIGSGGLLGKGLFHGPQTQGRFVPEQQTDFIFTVAGEELGLVGAGAILVLLGLILWRALCIGRAAPDLFGRLVAAGVVTWFTFQAFQNIGMCLGIMPVTGLPLPFVSYGGSSMFAGLLAVGLLQNVTRARKP